MKEYTEIVFILDKSGSMHGLEEDTIGGYNSFLESQKKLKGEAVVSTVLFDSTYDVLHNRIPLSKIKPLTRKDYMAGGSTALLDAVGSTIDMISYFQKKERGKKATQTIFVIITDGMENASREYTYTSIQKMIQEKRRKEDWKFIFLGANIEAPEFASKLGIDKRYARKHASDSIGTAMNYRVLDQAIQSMRYSEDANIDDLLDEIEEYEKSKRRKK